MPSSSTSSLQVCLEQKPVGQLQREHKQAIFNYLPETPHDQFISLTMPVRAKSYAHPQLHPIFEMHLPEGYLKSVIQKHFSKITATDDFGLLKLLANNIRGRITYRTDAESNILSEAPLTLDELLHPQDANLFSELVERFALRSALSGVQPKVLAQLHNKATLSLDDYIVKAWSNDYPQLALNEFYAMQAVKAADIAVPEFHLSDDDALFIMKRFDLSDDGQHPGFEDMCVLQAKQRDDKYTGSYEQIAKTIKLFTSAAYKHSSLEQFYKMIVLNTHLQNGDAHLKNFGLLYDGPDSVRLAPAYDVVSTTCYIKQDIAALTLMGSKKWWPKKHLIEFGINACDLTRRQAEQKYDQCMNALTQTAEQVQRRLEGETKDDKIQVLTHLLTRMKATE